MEEDTFSSLHTRISQLEEENKSLLELNAMFQSELKQKTEALEKSTLDYSNLKTHYEELLLRVTELHQENQAFISPPHTPPSSPQLGSNSIIDSLHIQIDQLSKRKNSLKIENQTLKSQNEKQHSLINKLKNENRKYKSQFEIYKEVIDRNVPFILSQNSMTLNPNLVESPQIIDILIPSTKKFIKLYKTEIIQHKKTKAKLQRVLNKCEILAQQLERNRCTISNQIQNYQPPNPQIQLEKDVQDLAYFLKRYERKCQSIDTF